MGSFCNSDNRSERLWTPLRHVDEFGLLNDDLDLQQCSEHPPIYLKVAKDMGVRRVSLLRSVMLPASMPQMVTALEQTWSFSWHALIGAEIGLRVLQRSG